MKKLTALVVIALVVVTLHLAAATPVLDNANGGLWKEYIHIPIAAPTTVDAQYMIKINGTNVSVYNSTGSLKVSGYCPAFWSYVNATGADIRVTNQSSELYFWIQDFNTTAKTATIWVNIPAGSSELRLYYGNSLALPSGYENGSKVFLFFDDFNTLDTTKWATGYATFPGATITVSGGVAHINTSSATWTSFHSYYTISNTSSVVIEAKEKLLSLNGNEHALYLLSSDNSDSNRFGIEEDGATTTTNTLRIETDVVGTYSYPATLIDVGNDWYIAKIIKWNSTYFTGIAEQNGVEAEGSANSATWSTVSWWIGGFTETSAGFDIDWIFVASLRDPATFGTPVQLPAGKPAPATVLINATYNAYDITGHLLINNSTTLLTPPFTYTPSTTSATGYLGKGSLTVPGLANITIYIDKNYTLNSVVCNGTAVTPSYIGTTVINGITYDVYNFTSPSAGLLIVTANVTPVTETGDLPIMFMGDTPKFNITSTISLTGVNATYGATVKVSVGQPLTLASVVYNGSTLTIPAPTTELINGKNYSVYTFTVYNSSSMLVTAEAQNQLYNTVHLYADGDENFTYLLVGELFKVVSPIPCNITLEGTTYTGVTSKEFTPMSPVPVTGLLYLFNLTTLQFGYKTFSIPVVWGRINLTVTPPIQVTKGVYSLTYSRVCPVNRLYAGENKIALYYMGMPVASEEFYLNHTNNGMNITIPVNATNVSGRCYNMSVVSSSRFNITNLHPVVPYGKFAVNHTGEVIITFENNSPVTVTVTGGQYAYYPPHLYLFGSGNATVTSYYRIKMNAESAVGIPMNLSVTVNGKKMHVYGMTDVVMPVNKYVIKFPQNVFGFQLKNATLLNVTFNLTNNTVLPTAIYRVPTHIAINAYRINTTSFKFPFPVPFIPLSTHTEQTTNGTTACLEGTLYNWYGTPVPDANVVVKITSLRTRYTITRILSTGSTGTFSTNFTAVPGVNYSIKVTYLGSPVYIGSEEEITVSGGALPPAPQQKSEINVLIFAGVFTFLGATIAAAYILHKRSVTKAMVKLEKRGRYFRRVK